MGQEIVPQGRAADGNTSVQAALLACEGLQRVSQAARSGRCRAHCECAGHNVHANNDMQ